MNVQKAIKYYFYFTLTVISVGFFSYNETVKHYYSSVLHTFSTLSQLEVSLSNDHITSNNTAYASKESVETTFYSPTSINVSPIKIDKNKNADAGSPGEKNIKVFSFTVKMNEENGALSRLKLFVHGEDSNLFSNVNIVDENNNVISKGVIAGDYIAFDNIDYLIEKNKKQILSVVADLDSSLQVNDRFQFSINKKEDITLTVKNKLYDFENIFPFKGSYVSVIGKPPTKIDIEDS